MTDRELLELAAKAAGMEIPDGAYHGPGFVWQTKYGYDAWSPLTNDGDALRLAVKLGIGIAHPEKIDTVWVCKSDCCDIYVQYDDDPYAATRRAIVMAAAEIGRGM